jgi:hypothetical protein
MLFTTIDEIKTFLPIGAGNDFLKLKPHIQNAENKFVKPLLGAGMYDELQEFYEAEYPAVPTETQEATKTLLEKVQHAVIHLAYYLGFDFMNVTTSSAGFQRTESDKLKGLYKYQEDNLKQYFSDSGFNALDDVLVFLEDNIEHFGEFELEPNYTALKESFLPTVKIVEEIPFNIQGSRLTLLALQPSVKFVEDTTIRTTLGGTIYLALKEEMVSDNPDADYIALLPYIRKPLVYLASALLMEETGATLGDKGLYFEKTDSTTLNTKIKGPSEAERIAAMIARNRNMGYAYLDMLKSYLSLNFETYEGTAVRFSRDNTDKKTFWA